MRNKELESMRNKLLTFFYVSASFKNKQTGRNKKLESILPTKPTFSFLIPYSLFLIFLASCSVQKQIAKSANEDVLSNKALSTAHVGISIYEPVANKYWFNYQGDKYFVPASNTKIPTCYAAMKYLGDSLVGLRYKKKNDSLYYISPTGDPTFLYQNYSYQPVYEFFKNTSWGTSYFFKWESLWHTKGLGSGWSWSDFMEPYMAERSPFPMYGNLIKFKKGGDPQRAEGIFHIPDGGYDPLGGDESDIEQNKFTITRELGTNRFFFKHSDKKFDSTSLTLTDLDNFYEVKYILADTIRKDDLHIIAGRMKTEKDAVLISGGTWQNIKTQPTDSLLKPMMHRSDNFFAEQSLLMVSNELLGVMNDEKIIDTLLKTDFKDLPQKPRWVDGSGLSRYNLFTPQDFVAILNKMKNEFGMERIKIILPTGGEGTISSYYKADSGYIYGKTGTLSGVVAFSGFLYTKKGKLLIFSTLVNNHQASATEVRRAIEKFIQGVRNKY